MDLEEFWNIIGLLRISCLYDTLMSKVILKRAIKIFIFVCFLQQAVEREKRERARIVLSLRDTIGDLKEAGSAEGKLKVEIIRLHEQLTEALTAKVHEGTLKHPVP